METGQTNLGDAETFSAVDRVAARMMRMVIAGAWPAGERMPTERDLADELDASRATVRAASARLVGWGVLVSRQGSGTIVLPRSQWRLGVLPEFVRSALDAGDLASVGMLLRDALEIRDQLVCDLLERAAPRIAPGSFDQLRLVVAQAWEARDEGAEFLRRDHAFFATLLAAAQMSASLWLVNELRLTYEALALAVGAVGATPGYVGAHLATIDALERRDAAAARAAFEGYLAEFRERLGEVLPEPLAALLKEK